jgi:hypothetical protein
LSLRPTAQSMQRAPMQQRRRSPQSWKKDTQNFPAAIYT